MKYVIKPRGSYFIIVQAILINNRYSNLTLAAEIIKLNFVVNELLYFIDATLFANTGLSSLAGHNPICLQATSGVSWSRNF